MFFGESPWAGPQLPSGLMGPSGSTRGDPRADLGGARRLPPRARPQWGRPRSDGRKDWCPAPRRQALAKGTVPRTDDGKSVQLRIRPLEEDAGNGVFINNGEEVDIFAYGEFMHVKYGRAKGYIKSQYVTVGCWSGIDGNGA